MTEQAPNKIKLLTLLHDAAESIIGDVVTPVKRLIRTLYEPLEERAMVAIATRFGFTMPDEELAAVTQIDPAMPAPEVRDLTTSGVLNHRINRRIEKPFSWTITRCWSADEAEERFLKCFKELCNA